MHDFHKMGDKYQKHHFVNAFVLTVIPLFGEDKKLVDRRRDMPLGAGCDP